MSGESDERAATFARGAGEPDCLGALGLDARYHYEPESSAAKQLLRSTQSVLSIARTHQNRSLFPEWASDGAESVDPDRPFALGDGGVTSSSENRGRAALRHPDCESSTRQTTSWENRIERVDARCHRFRCPVSDRCRIWKSML